MRALFATSFAFALVGLAFACQPLADDGTPCGRAKNMLGECGVMLPLLESDACTGTAEAVSRCILTSNGSCDALAAMSAHLDQCVAADAGPLPTDFPEVRADDAGHVDARIDANSSVIVNDASTTFDASTTTTADDASIVVDAGIDGSLVVTNAVFDQSGTIAAGAEQSFQTVRLSAGTYAFSASINGAADVYVRKGFAPTTTTFDCKTSDPSCTETIATTAILYVLVHGNAAQSQFRVIAQP